MTAVPTTPKGQRTWHSILAAARTVFGRDGFVAARMSDVADEAGLSMGGLYRYFGNKDDLFEELIGDIHQELYEASRSGEHRFADEPYEALLDANRGYLTLYNENRNVMRAFVEAASVEARFQTLWWDMRTRHARRFADSMRHHHQAGDLEGVPLHLAADAMACLVEQCAYVWLGHQHLQDQDIDVELAARTVTRAWYRMFFD